MAEIILITGGSRSGKSSYALNRAEAFPGRRAFVATCPHIDEEMDARILRHQHERANRDWHLIEEQTEITAVIKNASQFDLLLVDCLTLWINNLLYLAGKRSLPFTEKEAIAHAEGLLEAADTYNGVLLFVTNEVGWGIVPEEPGVRLYRDLVGRCNQVIATGADEVILVSCGIPLYLKASEK